MRCLILLDTFRTPATTDTSADASTHNAVSFAATIEDEMNEVAAQMEQLCKRNDLCGKLTLDNKDEWKNCIKDIKEYLKQNMTDAQTAIDGAEAWLGQDSIKDKDCHTVTCNEAGAPNATLKVNLKDIRDEVATAKADLAKAKADMKTKCDAIDAELAAICP